MRGRKALLDRIDQCLMIGWLLPLSVLCACGGGGTIPGTDGRRVEPPEDLGCTDESRWVTHQRSPGARAA